jgi:ATP-binding cassette subfamily A (ABC1) protein 3
MQIPKLPLFISRGRKRRQTIALTKKNLLIFYKSPITTIIRALLLPLAVALVLCYLKDILSKISIYNSPEGFASSSKPIKDLGDAVGSEQKLVFVRNGIKSSDIDPVINGILSENGMDGTRHNIVDDPNDLFDICPQSLAGTSDCFAAVIFTNWNSSNVDYIIALDSE